MILGHATLRVLDICARAAATHRGGGERICGVLELVESLELHNLRGLVYSLEILPDVISFLDLSLQA